MAEEFTAADNPNVKITVGLAGDKNGFTRLCTGEIDIANATRPIQKAEKRLCQKNGIAYIEVPIAYDGLLMLVNRKNTWMTCLTPQELIKLWEPNAQGKITQWSQVNPQFPQTKIVLFSPKMDDETYQSFLETVINSGVNPSKNKGKDDENRHINGLRQDITWSEDDNTLRQGLENNPDGLGFLSFANFDQNTDQVRTVAIQNQDGQCVEPSAQTIADGRYNPLSHPLFIYVNKKFYLEKPQVAAFMQYQVVPEYRKVMTQNGYVPLPDALALKTQAQLAAYPYKTPPPVSPTPHTKPLEPD
jgi:phosphate transport system substrate-binding protein